MTFMNNLKSLALWQLYFAGAWAFAVLALNQGETVNALWIVVAAVCVYIIAYRFYGQFIGKRVMELDDNRPTLPPCAMTAWIMCRP